ncbi:hypothetical protein OC835_006722, partial [Tilletia horrida]
KMDDAARHWHEHVRLVREIEELTTKLEKGDAVVTAARQRIQEIKNARETQDARAHRQLERLHEDVKAACRVASAHKKELAALRQESGLEIVQVRADFAQLQQRLDAALSQTASSIQKSLPRGPTIDSSQQDHDAARLSGRRDGLPGGTGNAASSSSSVDDAFDLVDIERP